MSYGILKTALMGLPLELQYRPHLINIEDTTDAPKPAAVADLESSETDSDEFASVLSTI